MRNLGIPTLALALIAAFCARPVAAEEMPANAREQMAGAVVPAPEEMRNDATVLGYIADHRLIPLREGDGDLICLADDPRDERFHVACYYKALEPFMARGRELRAEGVERGEVRTIREQEIKDGKLEMPPQPTALYSITCPAGCFDPVTASVSGGNRVYVVYIPYATPESTGLTSTPATGTPWLMSPSKPWAHIMLVQPAETEEGE